MRTFLIYAPHQIQCDCCSRFHLGAIKSWDSVVSIVTGYRLDDQGIRVQVPVGSRIFTSPCLPDRLWDPPNLLSN
jgi:hypothetical protein